MSKAIFTTSLALVLGAGLLSGCGQTNEAPAAPTEPVASQEAVEQVETTAVVIEEGPITAAIVVEESTDASEQAFIASTEVQTLTAEVVSVNLETRDVVLLGSDGVELELVADEKLPNLDQVSPGDRVNAKFMEQVTIQLVQGEDIQALELSADRDIQAEEGQMPARGEIHKTVQVYTVEAIDLEANTFKLKNVNGEVEQFLARNPGNLAKANIGDGVVVTTTEAMAVEVIKADSGS